MQARQMMDRWVFLRSMEEFERDCPPWEPVLTAFVVAVLLFCRGSPSALAWRPRGSQSAGILLDFRDVVTLAPVRARMLRRHELNGAEPRA